MTDLQTAQIFNKNTLIFSLLWILQLLYLSCIWDMPCGHLGSGNKPFSVRLEPMAGVPKVIQFEKPEEDISKL